MNKQILAACAVALCLGCFVTPAQACWDNTDSIIADLQKLNLTTDQMKAIFAMRDEQRAVVARAHKEHLGCAYHEKHEGQFRKASIGVLDNKQFETYTGRVRTSREALSYDIYLLNCEIAKLSAELASYSDLGEAAAKGESAEKKSGCAEKKSGCCGKK